jgi:predicted esterase
MQWFGLVDRYQEAMLNGASAAMRIVGQFILEQIKRFSISAKQTAILGCSQGGMMAVHTGINMKKNPRVLLCYSGLLIQGENSNVSLTCLFRTGIGLAPRSCVSQVIRSTEKAINPKVEYFEAIKDG